MKKISIKDVAEKCGTSITTVSFVLNGKAEEKRIGKPLADQILSYVKESGYQANQFARGLRTGKTHTIGLIVEDISNPFFADIAKLIEDSAYKKGYKIMYCSTEDNTERTKELIKMFVDRNLDGYIITPSAGIEPQLQLLIQKKIPIVLFDRYFPNLETDYVTIDNVNAARKATKHLFDSGFQNIAFITTTSQQTQMLDRLQGYDEVVREFDAEPNVIKLEYHDSHEHNVEAIKKYLSENKQVQSVFFATNYLAALGLEAVRELRLEIGKELGIIAFDDQNFFKILSPSITAIAQPIEEIAQKLIDILLDKMENPQKVTERVVLSTKLIVRESTVASKKVK